MREKKIQRKKQKQQTTVTKKQERKRHMSNVGNFLHNKQKKMRQQLQVFRLAFVSPAPCMQDYARISVWILVHCAWIFRYSFSRAFEYQQRATPAHVHTFIHSHSSSFVHSIPTNQGSQAAIFQTASSVPKTRSVFPNSAQNLESKCGMSSIGWR